MQFDANGLASPWFVYPSTRSKATVRLFCLPYAGGGAAPFRPWAHLLPPEVELCIVQLPGRETRLRETPYASMTSLVEDLATAIAPALDRPYALFGHSMGALAAFELVCALQRHRRDAPMHVFVSGRRAPQLPDPEPPISHLADDSFVREIMRRYNAIPKVILDDQDMLRVFLPTLRADLAMLESHVYRDSGKLDCPITAFGGVHDPRASREDLVAWRAQTRRSFQVHQFPGDHFYLNPQRQALVAQIADLLAASD
jgi:medium-chain acyl-[acyl-carrier-protein] hydrolase